MQSSIDFRTTHPSFFRLQRLDVKRSLISGYNPSNKETMKNNEFQWINTNHSSLADLFTVLLLSRRIWVPSLKNQDKKFAKPE